MALVTMSWKDGFDTLQFSLKSNASNSNNNSLVFALIGQNPLSHSYVTDLFSSSQLLRNPPEQNLVTLKMEAVRFCEQTQVHYMV
jgi:hypothetical protein